VNKISRQHGEGEDGENKFDQLKTERNSIGSNTETVGQFVANNSQCGRQKVEGCQRQQAINHFMQRECQFVEEVFSVFSLHTSPFLPSLLRAFRFFWQCNVRFAFGIWNAKQGYRTIDGRGTSTGMSLI
jgi:hypothetical protein